MDFSDQTFIPKRSKGLGDGLRGQVRENPRKILGSHPNPIMAVMAFDVPLLLFQAEVGEPIVNGCRGKTQPLGQFKLE